MKNLLLIVALLFNLVPFLTAQEEAEENIQFDELEEENSVLDVSFSIIPSAEGTGEQQFDLYLPIYQRQFGKYDLATSFSYNLTHFDYSDDLTFPDFLSTFHSFGVDVELTRTLSKNWALQGRFSPLVNTNFRHRFTNKDYFFTGGLFAIWQFGNKIESELTFGLGYFTYNGIPSVLPEVSYFVQFGDFELDLGYPFASVNYYLSDYFTVNAYYESAGNSYQFDIDVPEGFSEALATSADVVGLGFEYYVTDWLAIKPKVGYTFFRAYDLYDADENLVDELLLDNALNFSVGISIVRFE